MIISTYYSGIKSGIHYSYVGGKGFGISTGVNYLYFNQNNLITPEIGFNYLGAFSINYGYSVPISKNNINLYTQNKIGIRISLNKVYALVFKMI